MDGLEVTIRWPWGDLRGHAILSSPKLSNLAYPERSPGQCVWRERGKLPLERRNGQGNPGNLFSPAKGALTPSDFPKCRAYLSCRKELERPMHPLFQGTPESSFMHRGMRSGRRKSASAFWKSSKTGTSQIRWDSGGLACRIQKGLSKGIETVSENRCGRNLPNATLVEAGLV